MTHTLSGACSSGGGGGGGGIECMHVCVHTHLYICKEGVAIYSLPLSLLFPF